MVRYPAIVLILSLWVTATLLAGTDRNPGTDRFLNLSPVSAPKAMVVETDSSLRPQLTLFITGNVMAKSAQL